MEIKHIYCSYFQEESMGKDVSQIRVRTEDNIVKQESSASTELGAGTACAWWGEPHCAAPPGLATDRSCGLGQCWCWPRMWFGRLACTARLGPIPAPTQPRFFVLTSFPLIFSFDPIFYHFTTQIYLHFSPSFPKHINRGIFNWI